VEAVDDAEVEELLHHDEDDGDGVVDCAGALGGGLDIDGAEVPGFGKKGEGGGVQGDVVRD